MSLTAELVIPISSKFIFGGIFAYGFGASLLSLGVSMAPKEEEATEEESEEGSVVTPVKRKKLNMDWGDMKKKDDSG